MWHSRYERRKANQYPSLVALADYLAQPDEDERFRFGFEILRNGLEARLARRNI